MTDKTEAPERITKTLEREPGFFEGRQVDYIHEDVAQTMVVEALEKAAETCVLTGQDLAEGDWGPEGRAMAVLIENRIRALIPNKGE